MDKEAWQATGHRVPKSQTQLSLSTHRIQLTYNILLVSDGQQSDSVLYAHIHSFFRFFSLKGNYRVLSRVPCAIQ